MRRLCEDCGLIYDDYDHLAICPHEKFELSESVKEMIARGELPQPDPDGDPRQPTEAERLEFSW